MSTPPNTTGPEQKTAVVTIEGPGMKIRERVPYLVALQIAAYLDQQKPQNAARKIRLLPS